MFSWDKLRPPEPDSVLLSQSLLISTPQDTFHSAPGKSSKNQSNNNTSTIMLKDREFPEDWDSDFMIPFTFHSSLWILSISCFGIQTKSRFFADLVSLITFKVLIEITQPSNKKFTFFTSTKNRKLKYERKLKLKPWNFSGWKPKATLIHSPFQPTSNDSFVSFTTLFRLLPWTVNSVLEVCCLIVSLFSFRLSKTICTCSNLVKKLL